MKTLDKTYVLNNKAEIISAIQNGSIFIYPTDTIYGLGCNALVEESVRKLREMKHRETSPFSVIAPSKEWITTHCVVEKEKIDEFLPGPYTLFLNRIDAAVAPSINPVDNTLGVRIPAHWFTEIVAEAGVPFVTTSVNATGEKHMEKLEDVSEEIMSHVDFCVYEGEKKGTSSEKVNLVS